MAITGGGLLEEAGTSTLRQVYLVTFPHPRAAASVDGVALVAPETMSKDNLLRCFQEACKHPVYVDAWNRQHQPAVPLQQAGVWRELHKPDGNGDAHAHDHVAVLAARQFRFLPVKRALLQLYGLASHWSCTHTGYWSVVRYLALPSAGKPQAALDTQPALWAEGGQHPPVDECTHEPLTASALRKRRMRAEATAAEAGAKEPKVSELDVWPIVVRHGFRNTADDQTAHLQLIAFAKERCSAAMQSFLFRHRHRLPGLIDDVWQWECVGDTLTSARQSREAALRVAAAGKCVCHGRWLEQAVAILVANNVPVRDLCRSVYEAFAAGRSEKVPVITFAGERGGEGKSFILKPMAAIFGHEYVFPSPQAGNFPLLDLPGKKVAFLDDWRFDNSVVPFATQCLWYDGSPLPITRPQNQPGTHGHFLYRGTAPIFVTTKLSDLEMLRHAAEDDPRTGKPRNADASMVLRRLKIFHFGKPVAAQGSIVPYCGHCFAAFILAQAAA